ncbi:MAG: hypothetical protein KF805_06765 [Phycisphaeraceae bacterium]|nr:hypothetical protein [Phycisphaeraceae bacterium]
MIRLLATLANVDPSPAAGLIGRGFMLVALLCLGLIVVMASLVLALLSRRRARQRVKSQETRLSRGEDPWRVSAERADVPTAEELYRASGFDKDDTRIEDSPDFGDGGPGDEGGSDRPRRHGPRKPDQF